MTNPWDPGSHRFGRLIEAARRGDIVAPADLRYLQGLPKQGAKETDTSRARIVSFLRGVYESTAETLPDVRDDTYDADEAVSVGLVVPELQDPYAETLGAGPEPVVQAGKKKKVHSKKFSISLNPDRKAAFEGQERFLPPGSMKDYWEQFNDVHPRAHDERPVSFTTFWKVWHQEFSFMKFRAASSHSMCATCLKHKLLIRAMCGHLLARKQQVQAYAAHLRAQYQDRLTYWDIRGVSRDRTPFEVCAIIDGMDQGKFAYPRSDLFRSKDLSGMNRPRAHIAASILHGRMVVFTVSPADLPKDANASIETTAHCIHLLSQMVPVSRMVLSIQSDNTPREVKNNHYLRWLCSLVSHGA